MNRWLKCVVCAILFSQTANAAKIQLPEEELATESVLPIFDKRPSVHDRRVQFSGRFDLGIFAGSNLNEPFNSGRQFGLSGSYHFNELHGVHFSYSMIPKSLTSYVTGQLDPKYGLGLKNAPYMSSLFLANYELTPYYGKISLTAHSVVNLAMVLNAGLGGAMIGDKLHPVATIGVAQKFFFTPNLSFRADLRLLAYKGPNVLKYQSGNLDRVSGQAKAGDFKQDMYYPVIITGGLVYLF